MYSVIFKAAVLSQKETKVESRFAQLAPSPGRILLSELTCYTRGAEDVLD